MYTELHPDAEIELTEHALYYETREPGLVIIRDRPRFPPTTRVLGGLIQARLYCIHVGVRGGRRSYMWVVYR